MLITYKGYLRKRKATDLHGTIYVRVTYLRNHIYLNLLEAIETKFWSSKRGIVREGHPNAVPLNELIAKEIYEARRKITEQRLRGTQLDFDNIKSLLQRKETGMPLADILKEYAGNMDMSAMRKSHMETMLKHCEENGLPVDVTKITEKQIADMRKQLNKSKKKNTVLSILNRLRTLLNYAVKKGYILKSPLDFIKLGEYESKTEFLTVDEVNRIEKLLPGLKGGRLQAAKVFLFCCYTGMRYSDAMNLSQAKTMQMDGATVLDYTVQKTKKQHFLPLLPKAVAMLPEVATISITNQFYNRELKEIGKAAKIQTVITTHIARHSFATIALNAGISMDIVQNLLAHSDVKTTKGYAQFMTGTITKELSKWG